jgi:hypothetical protein
MSFMVKVSKNRVHRGITPCAPYFSKDLPSPVYGGGEKRVGVWVFTWLRHACFHFTYHTHALSVPCKNASYSFLFVFFWGSNAIYHPYTSHSLYGIGHVHPLLRHPVCFPAYPSSKDLYRFHGAIFATLGIRYLSDTVSPASFASDQKQFPIHEPSLF